MFSVKQKRAIAAAVQEILRETGNPELPRDGEIKFSLHVAGKHSWSWADIRNNGAVSIPDVNDWNEKQARKAPPRECTWCAYDERQDEALPCSECRGSDGWPNFALKAYWLTHSFEGDA